MPDTTQALSNYLRTSVGGTDANPVLARSSPGEMNWTNCTADGQLVAASPGSVYLPKSHPCRLGGMLVLVEDAAEAVAPADDVKAGVDVRRGNW
jgi:hypothetical protein